MAGSIYPRSGRDALVALVQKEVARRYLNLRRHNCLGAVDS